MLRARSVLGEAGPSLTLGQHSALPPPALEMGPQGRAARGEGDAMQGWVQAGGCRVWAPSPWLMLSDMAPWEMPAAGTAHGQSRLFSVPSGLSEPPGMQEGHTAKQSKCIIPFFFPFCRPLH